MTILNYVVLSIIGIISAYCAYTDYKEMKITNKATFSIILIGLLLRVANAVVLSKEACLTYLLTGIGGCIIFLLLALFVPIIGMGDYKLMMGYSLAIGMAKTLEIFLLGNLIMCVYMGFKYSGILKNVFVTEIKDIASGNIKHSIGMDTKIPMAPAFFIAYVIICISTIL